MRHFRIHKFLSMCLTKHVLYANACGGHTRGTRQLLSPLRNACLGYHTQFIYSLVRLSIALSPQIRIVWRYWIRKSNAEKRNRGMSSKSALQWQARFILVSWRIIRKRFDSIMVGSRFFVSCALFIFDHCRWGCRGCTTECMLLGSSRQFFRGGILWMFTTLQSLKPIRVDGS